jgi:hypothetical protein
LFFEIWALLEFYQRGSLGSSSPRRLLKPLKNEGYVVPKRRLRTTNLWRVKSQKRAYFVNKSSKAEINK